MKQVLKTNFDHEIPTFYTIIEISCWLVIGQPICFFVSFFQLTGNFLKATNMQGRGHLSLWGNLTLSATQGKTSFYFLTEWQADRASQNGNLVFWMAWLFPYMTIHEHRTGPQCTGINFFVCLHDFYLNFEIDKKRPEGTKNNVPFCFSQKTTLGMHYNSAEYERMYIVCERKRGIIFQSVFDKKLQ